LKKRSSASRPAFGSASTARSMSRARSKIPSTVDRGQSDRLARPRLQLRDGGLFHPRLRFEVSQGGPHRVGVQAVGDGHHQLLDAGPGAAEPPLVLV